MTTIIWAKRVLSVNSEKLIMQMADRLAEDGYRDAGYTYVSIDVSLQKLMNVGFSTVLVPPKGDSFLNFQTFTIFLCIIFFVFQDCWSNKERDPSGNLQPNSTRFPNGMKALADYVRIVILSREISD